MTAGPGLLAALGLAAQVADDLVVGTSRDVHGAVSRRVYAVARGVTGGRSRLPQRIHEGIAAGVYGGLRAGLRGAARVLGAVDSRGLGPRLEDSSRGRFAVAALNGLVGDRLVDDASPLAIRMAVRSRGRDVPLEPAALTATFPDATGDLVVFMHGLGENESYWQRRAAETGGSYGDRLARRGWTPLFLRLNTGLPIAENGVSLAALLDDVVRSWPVPVRRLALVGHSMGGLVVRAACAVTGPGARWTDRVTDVVTLGSPHLGAPVERGLALGSRALGVLPESAPFGRILEYRSVGILDLRVGLARDVQNLPRARYRLVAATLATSRRHPVSEVLGDALVRYPSATGRPRFGREMFPGAEVLHVRGGHFDLLNHPEVYDALTAWLASPPEG